MAKNKNDQALISLRQKPKLFLRKSFFIRGQSFLRQPAERTRDDKINNLSD
jgi:hypothetical protein